jgi:SAM-dependent methyltransferase
MGYKKTISKLRDYLNNECSDLVPEADLLRKTGPFESIEQYYHRSLISFESLLTLTHLNRETKVLDYGCGLGRVAMPLSGYLEDNANYFGVDIQKVLVESCKTRFSSRLPNMKFCHLDIFNKTYNPRGRPTHNDVRDLVPSGEFNVAFAFSVFTHILDNKLEETAQYLFDSLAPKGQLLATFFLLNEGSRSSIALGKTNRKFSHQYENCFIEDLKFPEFAVAFSENDVFAALENVGFKIGSVNYGGWSKTVSNPLSWQDTLICTKE